MVNSAVRTPRVLLSALCLAGFANLFCSIPDRVLEDGGSAGVSSGGGSGGQAGTGGAGCAPLSSTDKGFENSLTTDLGTWEVVANKGTLEFTNTYKQLGSMSLRLEESDSTHNANTEEVVRLNLSGRLVDEIHFYNIAESSFQSQESVWAKASVFAHFSDGSHTQTITALYHVPKGEGCPCLDSNPTYSKCSLNGTDGRTWYRYDFVVPSEWDHRAITLALGASADGGDSQVVVRATGWFDGVEVLP